MRIQLLNKFHTIKFLKMLKNLASNNHDFKSYMAYSKAIYITRKSHAKLYLIERSKVIALSESVYNDIVYTLKDYGLLDPRKLLN